MTSPVTDNQSTPSGNSEPGSEANTGGGNPPVRVVPTPELVENEAQRGDFVLRWAVVLFAVLLATTEIAETATLVHIKAGEYMAANGCWPPRHDVFSYTAGDRPWTNFSWLFDLLVAGVFAVGGVAGLTVFKALAAAATFLVVKNTCRKNVSTWWNSVCATVAVIACQSRFNVLPEVVTLIGVALILYEWNQWEASGRPNFLQHLLPVFVLWSNLDSRAFVGYAILLLLAAGETLSIVVRSDRSSSMNRVKTLWIWTAGCFVAFMFNPFGWKALFQSPWTIIDVEYPALRHIYAGEAGEIDVSSIVSSPFWRMPTPGALFGVFLIFTALLTLWLNRKRRPLAHFFAVMGSAGLAVASAHELAVASLVSAVVAGINAQDWYKARFRQTYSIATGELIFSRGGRAATVLGLFTLAFLAISGKLWPPHHGSLGFGFTHEMAAQIDGLAHQVQDAYDDRPFHFQIGQGDVLIWLGQRSFVDSRVELFAAPGFADLLATHKSVCEELSQSAGISSSEIWKAVFDQYGITHVLPNLSGSAPDYKTFLNLRKSRDWKMSKLGPASASFYRTDSFATDPKLRDYLGGHSVNYVREAFRSEDSPPCERFDWARSASAYDKYLWRRRTARPNSIQLALHYQRQIDDALSIPGFQLPAQTGAALAHLALRNANAGLSDEPRSSDGYRVVGAMCEFLGRIELRVLAGNPLGPLPLRRYIEAAVAYQQAVVVEPANRGSLKAMAALYSSQRKFDLAIRSLDEYQRLGGPANIPKLADNRSKLDDTLVKLRDQMAERVTRVEERVTQLLQNERANLRDIAGFAYDQGCVLRAIQLLEGSPNLLTRDPEVQTMFSLMQLEAGRCEEAEAGLARIEQESMSLDDALRWQTPAAFVALGRAQYSRSRFLLQSGIQSQQSLRFRSVLDTMPLFGSPRQWPLAHVDSVAGVMLQLPRELAGYWHETALTEMEEGRNKEAADAFHTLLSIDPNTSYRPLTAFYLNLLTGEDIDPRRFADQIPITPDMFTPDTKPAE